MVGYQTDISLAVARGLTDRVLLRLIYGAYISIL